MHYTFQICKYNLHYLYGRPKNGGAVRVKFILGHPVYTEVRLSDHYWCVYVGGVCVMAHMCVIQACEQDI